MFDPNVANWSGYGSLSIDLRDYTAAYSNETIEANNYSYHIVSAETLPLATISNSYYLTLQEPINGTHALQIQLQNSSGVMISSAWFTLNITVTQEPSVVYIEADTLEVTPDRWMISSGGTFNYSYFNQQIDDYYSETINQIEGDTYELAQRISTLEAWKNLNGASIEYVDTVYASLTEAWATKETQLNAWLDGTKEESITAEIYNQMKVYVDTESAMAQNYTMLQANMDSMEDSLNASITQLDTAKVGRTETGVFATASEFSSLQSTVNGHTASINTTYNVAVSANNKADDLVDWRAETSNLIVAPNGDVTGVSAMDGSDVTSTVTIRADLFQVKTANGSKTPLIVTGDTVKINADLFANGSAIKRFGVISGSTTVTLASGEVALIISGTVQYGPSTATYSGTSWYIVIDQNNINASI